MTEPKQSIFETYGDEPTILDAIEHRKKDWTGSRGCVFKMISATSHGSGQREANDYYATDPKCAHDIIKILNPDKDTTIWEPACGEGHLSKEFEKLGFNVISSDLIDRGYGTTGVDFLKSERPSVDGKLLIATNPPYRYAQEFVEHSLEILNDGGQAAFFLKLTFLEGQKRQRLFKKLELESVNVYVKRAACVINGDFENVNNGGAVAYAWFVFKKGNGKQPVVEWI